MKKKTSTTHPKGKEGNSKSKKEEKNNNSTSLREVMELTKEHERTKDDEEKDRSERIY